MIPMITSGLNAVTGAFTSAVTSKAGDAADKAAQVKNSVGNDTKFASSELSNLAGRHENLSAQRQNVDEEFNTNEAGRESNRLLNQQYIRMQGESSVLASLRSFADANGKLAASSAAKAAEYIK